MLLFRTRKNSYPKEVTSRQKKILTCLSNEHFHKEGTDIRLDFQSVFGTNIYLSAERIHGFIRNPHKIYTSVLISIFFLKEGILNLQILLDHI